MKSQCPDPVYPYSFGGGHQPGAHVVFPWGKQMHLKLQTGTLLGQPYCHIHWAGLSQAYCTFICPFCQVIFIHMCSTIVEESCQWIYAPSFSLAFPSPAGAQATCRAAAAWGAHAAPAQVVLMHALNMVASIFSARGSHPRSHLHQALVEKSPQPATCPSIWCAGGFSWSLWHGRSRPTHALPCQLQRTHSFLNSSLLWLAGDTQGWCIWCGMSRPCYPGSNTKAAGCWHSTAGSGSGVWALAGAFSEDFLGACVAGKDGSGKP